MAEPGQQARVHALPYTVRSERADACTRRPGRWLKGVAGGGIRIANSYWSWRRVDAVQGGRARGDVVYSTVQHCSVAQIVCRSTRMRWTAHGMTDGSVCSMSTAGVLAAA